MTQLLQEAFRKASLLPEPQQDSLAKTILEITEMSQVSDVVPSEHTESVMNGLAQASRGEFAREDEIQEIFNRFKK
jgi:predicted transcriptional regulator